MLVSIVVPCYNEEAVLEELHGRLTAMIESVPEATFEIIYTDDGSREQTPEILRRFQSQDHWNRQLRVRVFLGSRN